MTLPDYSALFSLVLLLKLTEDDGFTWTATDPSNFSSSISMTPSSTYHSMARSRTSNTAAF